VLCEQQAVGRAGARRRRDGRARGKRLDDALC
jgi:hypothetical protein